MEFYRLVMDRISQEYQGYMITSDKPLMNVQDIHRWLSEESYWSKHIPYEKVKMAFDHSFCVGVLLGERQIGYARLITDHATFGYLADVYVEEAHRSKGISKKMMQLLFDLDWVKELRVIKLATKDAQELYEKYGFAAARFPERNMEVVRTDIYERTV